MKYTNPEIWLLLACLVSMPAMAQENRDVIIVAVGNNAGLEGEEPLRYAHRDARRFADLFIELAGAREHRVFVLQDESPQALERALTEIRGQAVELSSRDQDLMVIFYYAGHGDERSLHLGEAVFSRSRLDELLTRIPAALKVVVIDSCQGSGGSRQRGVVPAEPFDISISGNPARGEVHITSASPGEPAQESDQLGGAVFSHYWLSGLRGPADRNADGQVSIHEAYTFAYSRTLLRTAANRAGVQHPVFDFDLEGAGPVILTRTRRGSAKLIFAPELDTRYLVYSLPGRHILAEVPARADRQTVLALPAGRFLLQRRGPKKYGVSQVDLPWGGERAIHPGQFTEVDYQRVALRGGQIEVHDWLLSARGLGHYAPRSAAPWAFGAELSLGYTSGRWLVELAANLQYASVDTALFTGEELRLGVQPSAGMRLGGSWYTLSLGAGFTLQPVWQRLVHREAERRQAVGLESEQREMACGFGPAVWIGFSPAIFSFTSLDVRLQYAPVWIRTLGEHSDSFEVYHTLALSFGVGRSL